MSDEMIYYWKREKLAEYAHNAWCGWKNYMFSKGIFHDDGTFTLPAWAAERWRTQATTPYDELPESEKESDREEAAKMLAIMDVGVRYVPPG